MTARSIPHAPVAITMLRRVIFIARTSFLTLLLQYTIRHPVPEVYRDYALGSSTCRTRKMSDSRREKRWSATNTLQFQVGTKRTRAAAVRLHRFVRQPPSKLSGLRVHCRRLGYR